MGQKQQQRRSHAAGFIHISMTMLLAHHAWCSVIPPVHQQQHAGSTYSLQLPGEAPGFTAGLLHSSNGSSGGLPSTSRRLQQWMYSEHELPGPSTVPGQGFHEKRAAWIKAHYNDTSRWVDVVGRRDSLGTETSPAISLRHSMYKGRAAYFIRGSRQRLGRPVSPELAAGLEANGTRYLVRGASSDDLVILAADPLQRHRAVYFLDLAHRLGLNMLLLAAGGEGAAGWPSLQPYPGVLDGHILRDGLDWLLHQALLRGLRVVLSLTDAGRVAHGGAAQYCSWLDPNLTISDFYTNDTVKSVYLDTLAGLLSRTNTFTGVEYRHDPTILGWELAARPRDPGAVGSGALLSWVNQMAGYLRYKAPHQLVLVGWEGYFGPSSPHHLVANPPGQVFHPLTSGPHLYDAQCEGVDFYQLHTSHGLDLAVTAVLPDEWLLCSTVCKLEWVTTWLAAHLREAVRLQKPLLVVGVGALRPHGWRAALVRQVQRQLQEAVARNVPVAGVVWSGVADPDASDVSGYNVYDVPNAVSRPSVPARSPAVEAGQELYWHHFFNRDAMLKCLEQQQRVESMDEMGISAVGGPWVQSWEQAVVALRGASGSQGVPQVKADLTASA